MGKIRPKKTKEILDLERSTRCGEPIAPPKILSSSLRRTGGYFENHSCSVLLLNYPLQFATH